MVDGIVVVGQLAALCVDHIHAGQGSLDAVQQAVGVLGSRSTAVVAVEKSGIVSIGTDDRQSLDVLGQRKYSVVVEQNHCLAGSLGCQGVVLLAADHVLAEVGPGQTVSRIEHTKFKAALKDLAQMRVKVGFLD